VKNKILTDILTPDEIKACLTEDGHAPVSASRHKASACQWYYLNNYILKTKKVDLNGGPVVGKFAHLVMSTYAKKLKDAHLESDLEDFEKTIAELRPQFRTMSEGEFDGIYEPLLSTAEKLIVPWEQMLDPELQIAFDWNLQKVDFNSPNAWVKMVLDLGFVNDEEAEVIDFKTQPGVPEEAELKKDIQVSVYPWGLSVWNPRIQAATVRFIYIRAGIVRQYRFPTALLSGVETRLRRFSNLVTEKIFSKNPIIEEWPAKPPDMCPYCSFWCPLSDIEMAPGTLVTAKTDITEVGELVRQWERQKEHLAEQIKKAKEHLKRRVNATEQPVTVKDGVFGFQSGTTYRFKTAGLLNVIEEAGLEIDNYVKIEKDKVLGMENEELLKKILDDGNCVTIGQRTNFKFTEKEEN
jgi:PD-(D/E)XK nuclease superfamily